MMTQMGARAGVAASSLIVLVLAAGCTGGRESTAAEEHAPKKNGINSAEESKESSVDLRKTLDEIGPAIPLYAGARYRDDLTRRDAVMVRNQYGAGAEVFTLATDDSYPQVFHYYTTYLAQFRGFPAQDTYPPEQKNWRTLEVPLNQAMQDPFIPGDALRSGSKQVILQIAETEAEPKTVIRYIVAPPAPAAVATGVAGPAQPAGR